MEVSSEIEWSVDDQEELVVAVLKLVDGQVVKRELIHNIAPGTPARAVRHQYRNALRARQGYDRRSGYDRRFAERVDSLERRTTGKYVLPSE